MKFNSKLVFALIVAFAVFNIVDMLTAAFAIEGEANLLTVLTGSNVVLWIGKIVLTLFVFLVYFFRRYKSRIWYFSYLYFVVFGIFLFAVGMITNIIALKDDSVMETASEMSDEQRTNEYSMFITITFIIPYLLSLFVFWVYDRSEKHVRYLKP